MVAIAEDSVTSRSAATLTRTPCSTLGQARSTSKAFTIGTVRSAAHLAVPLPELQRCSRISRLKSSQATHRPPVAGHIFSLLPAPTSAARCRKVWPWARMRRMAEAMAPVASNRFFSARSHLVRIQPTVIFPIPVNLASAVAEIVAVAI